MFTKLYFEDYILQTVRKTLGRTITEKDVALHAAQMDGFLSPSADASVCIAQPFKQLIADVRLVFSIGIRLAAYQINEIALTHGYDHLCFFNQVFIGDTIKSSITIKDKYNHQKPAYGLVTVLVEVFNQQDELVMMCEQLLLVQKKEVI